jgi:hypothetical protein
VLVDLKKVRTMLHLTIRVSQILSWLHMKRKVMVTACNHLLTVAWDLAGWRLSRRLTYA